MSYKVFALSKSLRSFSLTTDGLKCSLIVSGFLASAKNMMFGPSFFYIFTLPISFISSFISLYWLFFIVRLYFVRLKVSSSVGSLIKDVAVVSFNLINVSFRDSENLGRPIEF